MFSFDDDMGGGAGGGDRDRDGDRDGDGFDLELDGLDDGSDNAQAEAVVSISSLSVMKSGGGIDQGDGGGPHDRCAGAIDPFNLFFGCLFICWFGIFFGIGGWQFAMGGDLVATAGERRASWVATFDSTVLSPWRSRGPVWLDTNSDMSLEGVSNLTAVTDKTERIVEDVDRLPTPDAWQSSYFKGKATAWFKDASASNEAQVTTLKYGTTRKLLTVRKMSPLIWDNVKDVCASATKQEELQVCCSEFYDVDGAEYKRMNLKGRYYHRFCSYRAPVMRVCAIAPSAIPVTIQSVLITPFGCVYPFKSVEQYPYRPPRTDIDPNRGPWGKGLWAANYSTLSNFRCGGETSATSKACDVSIVSVEAGGSVRDFQTALRSAPPSPIVEVRTWDDPSIQESLLTDGLMYLPPTKEEGETAGGTHTTVGIFLFSVGAGLPALPFLCIVAGVVRKKMGYECSI